jgi:vacuolar-type H+-ATPase subunit I/STV1
MPENKREDPAAALPLEELKTLVPSISLQESEDERERLKRVLDHERKKYLRQIEELEDRVAQLLENTARDAKDITELKDIRDRACGHWKKAQDRNQSLEEQIAHYMKLQEETYAELEKAEGCNSRLRLQLFDVLFDEQYIKEYIAKLRKEASQD